ncbi:class I SAM-dependent methyltransferase [Actinomycetospora sp. NBRC 106378]|uniref:class I SAM-dependent methyltransferase n=1 Tax=Actinomycetospora sp. NBRC 106378 TaxID=3032208 RepID=UPI0024A27DD6|nr:class I SAM-dependent methyltransferase [Actinomycetospora sp. NBRC 106378]GLZ52734.1 hypothetical protein Acsp07_23510 [Actinomycetospora sp. NBRC 106378]
MGDTSQSAYTERLSGLQTARWKRVLDVQAPYRRKLRSIVGGRRALDVGCGIGRLLSHLPAGSLGVDHNEHSVAYCRRIGLDAVTVDELGEPSATFDALVAGHLLEHLPEGGQPSLLLEYLPWLRPGALVILICPQERGYLSDSTHLTFCDHAKLARYCEEVGLTVQEQSSFPFPRFAGKWFVYNEFVTVAQVPEAA